MKFSKPKTLNDPLEFNPLIKNLSDPDFYKYSRNNGRIQKSEAQKLYDDVLKPRINKYGVLSLSTNEKSYSMWNFYSNGHRGMLLEFNNDFLEKASFKIVSGKTPMEVDYTNDISIEAKKLKEMKYNDEELVKILFRKKYKVWEAEKEYRVISEIDSDSENDFALLDYDPSMLRSVIFGANMEPSLKKKTMDYLKSYNVKLCQSFILKDLISDNPSDFIEYLDLTEEKNRPILDSIADLPSEVFISNNQFLSEPIFKNSKS
ncbi:MAG: DUF2971 domain-containing protein [Gracilimonas sp.]|nr:DUF2971 domain-containing protein [Gracilimonas sp.]